MSRLTGTQTATVEHDRGAPSQLPKRLPLRASSMHPSALAFVLFLSACDSQDGGPLRWEVTFACSRHAAAAERVQVGIAQGSCPAAGEPLYRQTIVRGTKGKINPPGEMDPGEYAFFARALDAEGRVLAEGCTVAHLPGSQSAELELAAATGCNGKGTGGMPPSCVPDDKDGDGTENCYDACSKDPGKVEPGRCGCGAEDRADSPTFQDAMGYQCKDWKGTDCKKAEEKWGYTASDELSLLASCPDSCDVCPQ